MPAGAPPDLTTPDGDTIRPIVSGSHPIIGMWCTDGECTL